MGPPSRIGIVGLGLIGGSLGLALRAERSAFIVGYDIDQFVAERALERGAIDEIANEISDLPKECDIIFVATPPAAIVDAVRSVAPFVDKDTVITDVASVKQPILNEASQIVSERGAVFIGGHPLAGSEQGGIESADADLLRGALWIICPHEETNEGPLKKLHRLLQSIGCEIVVLDPETHDKYVALVSHVPHIVAFALMKMVLQRPSSMRFVGGSFRDGTRVAASEPSLWANILTLNNVAVRSALNEFREALETVEAALGDINTLRDSIAAAKEARLSMFARPQKKLAEMRHIVVSVEDRPGSLVQVLGALGEEGINIEDVSIAHGAHAGVVRVMVFGADAAERGVNSLDRRGISARIELLREEEF